MQNFYPRPPRGGRQALVGGLLANARFLSTPSARRATLDTMHLPGKPFRFLSTPSARRATDCIIHAWRIFPISIHALREEGDINPVRKAKKFVISIHALREEGDGKKQPEAAPQQNFYPRPPRGGRHNTEAVKLLLKEFLSTPSARRATCWRWCMAQT